MATLISTIESQARIRLEEITPRFWTSAELTAIIIAGIKDLWREIANLKQEHFLTVDNTNVTLAANTATLTGVPSDVHKIYLIEPRDVSATGTSRDLVFLPLDYNHPDFRNARARDAFDVGGNDTIFYAITDQGSPVAAPTVRIAPQVTSTVNLTLVYVPTISSALTGASNVPIPGEADNALVAWTVAYARAKEREDRAPDPAWIQLYAGERNRLLASLGLRQLQEPEFVDAMFSDYW